MHGFNQGRITVGHLIDEFHPDIFLFQEHWLSPAGLSKFDIFRPEFISFGCSAMSESVSQGMLRGRPYGGVMVMFRSDLCAHIETIHCSDRFTVIKIGNIIIINVYLPCVGTDNRFLICQNNLEDAWSWRMQFPLCECLIAGDFNVDLDSIDNFSIYVNQFIAHNLLHRCDNLFSGTKTATYVNQALQCQSTIDYFLCSSPHIISNFTVLDPHVNFSDHLPITVVCNCTLSSYERTPSRPLSVTQLRWDKANIHSYYYHTGSCLEPLMSRLNNLIDQFKAEDPNIGFNINQIYEEIVTILSASSKLFVPLVKKIF